mmetsp:Transcript_11520/g.28166  ORF Transcript_11520/g.28166 Transcript_11520/m.28166 type:complete len:233 (+) Transcript_11520:1972-2670(+)
MAYAATPLATSCAPCHRHCPACCCRRCGPGPVPTGAPASLDLAAHPVEEPRERVPVVKHEVTHAQKRDLFQPPRARVPAKGGLCDALKRIVVVPLQCVLPCQGHTMLLCTLNDLLQQRLRATPPLRRVLAVAHLHACEAQPRIDLGQHLDDGFVPVTVPRVVVARCELCRMGSALEPPVHACELHAQLARWLELVDNVPVSGLFQGPEHAWPAMSVEHLLRSCEDALRVLDQ